MRTELIKPSQFMIFSAHRSMRGILKAANDAGIEHVVLVRTLRKRQGTIYYYIYSTALLNRLARSRPMGHASAERFLDLHESSAALTLENRQNLDRHLGRAADSRLEEGAVLLGPDGDIVGIAVDAQEPLTNSPPAARGRDSWLGAPARWVRDLFDLTSILRVPDGITEILLPKSARPEQSSPYFPESQETGPARENQSGETAAAFTLSASAPPQIACEQTSSIHYRVQSGEDAHALAAAMIVSAPQHAEREKIRVQLSLAESSLDVIDETFAELDPPARGHAIEGAFRVRGRFPSSTARAAVKFWQGTSELGTLSFKIKVSPQLDTVADATPVSSEVAVRSRDSSDSELLVLMIEEIRKGDEIRYRFELASEGLGLHHVRLHSQPLQPRSAQLHPSAKDYIGSIYDRLSRPLTSGERDRFPAEIRAVGAQLCAELLDIATTQLLWKLRDRIRTIQITSWEAYIPWELVLLRNPDDKKDLSARFLAEYNLVRTDAGLAPPRHLGQRCWQYFAAEFPSGRHAEVNDEADYFEGARGEGLEVKRIGCTYDDLMDALRGGDFDVLHLSCHGESMLEQIEHSYLLIGEETGDYGVEDVTVDTTVVAAEIDLKRRQPLVFLNACESGQMGPLLTRLGGWPRVFLDAGAGAFVGASWPVRNQPATLFATAFYDALRQGATLAEAAHRGRENARKAGDASWLAFKVYGHPQARFCGADDARQ